MDSVNLEEDGAGFRGPPPVQPPSDEVRRQSQPSVSIEQAAKPTFQITVGDPHKVGDLTSSHIVYQVRTKVVLARATMRRALILTTDNFEGIPGVGVRRRPQIPRLPLVIQFTARQ